MYIVGVMCVCGGREMCLVVCAYGVVSQLQNNSCSASTVYMYLSVVVMVSGFSISTKLHNSFLACILPCFHVWICHTPMCAFCNASMCVTSMCVTSMCVTFI